MAPRKTQRSVKSGQAYSVLFLPERRRVTVAGGAFLLAAAAAEGIQISSTCGGKGTCGKCRVLVRPEKGSQRRMAYQQPVLACQTAVRSDLIVDVVVVAVSVQRKSELNLLKAALPAHSEPGFRKVHLALPPPPPGQPGTDRERLLEALRKTGTGWEEGRPPELALEALRELPGAMPRRSGGATAVVAGGRVLAVEPGDTTPRAYGVAVDIGTTSVVATLVDLVRRKALDSANAGNPQNGYGADVISRINHCVSNPGGLRQLQLLAVQAVNSLIDGLCRKAKVDRENIYRVTLAGNPTMMHLFLGISPARLAVAPFSPATTGPVAADAREVGLRIAPHGQVHVLPAISGFVGADTVAMILAVGLHKRDGVRLAIDVGTNGEMVVAHPGGLVACSTAAGPAFEGARIEHGITASEGAIEKVAIGRDVRIQTIGNQPPIGICGSGLIDAVSQMVAAGVLEPSGRMCPPEEAGHLPPALRKRLVRVDGSVRFVLAPAGDTPLGGPIELTQRDIRELQLSKAAIRAGFEILMEQVGVTTPDLDAVYLAGAFGNYIDPANALGIGLCPPAPLSRFEAVGNAAGVGAQMALLSEEARKEAETIARSVEHVDLSTSRVFQQHFMAALNFPEPRREPRRKGTGRRRPAAR